MQSELSFSVKCVKRTFKGDQHCKCCAFSKNLIIQHSIEVETVFYSSHHEWNTVCLINSNAHLNLNELQVQVQWSPEYPGA